MDRWRSRGGKSQRREEKRRRKKIKKRKSQKKEDPGARKGRKVASTVFTMICGSGGSKSRLARAASAEPAGQMRDEKVHAGVARSRHTLSRWGLFSFDGFLVRLNILCT